MEQLLQEISAKLSALETRLADIEVGRNPKAIGGIDLAMEVTGLTKGSIYRLTFCGKIPHSKRGKYIYFSRAELEAWLLKNKRGVCKEGGSK